MSRACSELVLSKACPEQGRGVEGQSRRVLGRVDGIEVAGLAVAVFASGGWPGRNGHPVTSRVKVGDVEDAGGAVGTVTIHLFSPWEPTFLD